MYADQSSWFFSRGVSLPRRALREEFFAECLVVVGDDAIQNTEYNTVIRSKVRMEEAISELSKYMYIRSTSSVFIIFLKISQQISSPQYFEI